MFTPSSYEIPSTPNSDVKLSGNDVVIGHTSTKPNSSLSYFK